MKLEYIPNIISFIRLFLIIPVVAALFLAQYDVALFIFLTAGVSDAIDGFLARRFNWISRLGSIIDPLADKLLLVFCFFVLAYLDHIADYLMWMVVGRDLIILAGAFAYHFLFGPYEFVPTYVSKVNTFFQILFILSVLFQLSFNTIPSSWIDALMYIVLLTTVFSCIDYIWAWGHRAIRAKGIAP